MDRTSFGAPADGGVLSGWPLGVLVGARSPMPPREAGLVSAGRVPGGWGASVPDAGHFPWVEAPGCVAAAMRRLVSSA